MGSHHAARYTRDFKDMVAWLEHPMPKTSIAGLLRVGRTPSDESSSSSPSTSHPLNGDRAGRPAAA
jgi:hypothetical protein